jgi:hypothetical protein
LSGKLCTEASATDVSGPDDRVTLRSGWVRVSAAVGATGMLPDTGVFETAVPYSRATALR